jgi:hypothetical protein
MVPQGFVVLFLVVLGGDFSKPCLGGFLGVFLGPCSWGFDGEIRVNPSWSSFL